MEEELSYRVNAGSACQFVRLVYSFLGGDPCIQCCYKMYLIAILYYQVFTCRKLEAEQEEPT